MTKQIIDLTKYIDIDPNTGKAIIRRSDVTVYAIVSIDDDPRVCLNSAMYEYKKHDSLENYSALLYYELTTSPKYAETITVLPQATIKLDRDPKEMSVDLSALIDDERSAEHVFVRDTDILVATVYQRLETEYWSFDRTAREFSLDKAQLFASMLYFYPHDYQISKQEGQNNLYQRLTNYGPMFLPKKEKPKKRIVFDVVKIIVIVALLLVISVALGRYVCGDFLIWFVVLLCVTFSISLGGSDLVRQVHQDEMDSLYESRKGSPYFEKTQEFFDNIQDNDEVWVVTSSPLTWELMMGRAGWVIVRGGKPTNHQIIIGMN